jgi:signal transduction histidine kinase
MSIVFLVLMLINAVAIWEILSSRRSAQSLAMEDLRLQTTAYARSLEAVLSSRRGDFIFLSQSPPLANAAASLTGDDPLAVRWRRLDIEGSLLLFLAAHPEVVRLVVRDSGKRPILAAGRREGAPVLLPAHDYASPARSADGCLVGSWPLRASTGDNPGELEAVLEVSRLLGIAVPGMGQQFSLIQQESVDEKSLAREEEGTLVVAIPIRDEGWPPPVRWVLLCQENQSHLLWSVTTLASRYRTTVILNFAVMTLALMLGIFGYQQFRRAMALEAENRQQARVRQLERQVLHSERLASVGQLAAGMAHEINNPLEGMANYLALLEEDLGSGRTEESVELVARVREGLERVAAIIRQVLTFADPGVTPHSPIELNEVLNETVCFVRSNPAFRRTEVIVRNSNEPLRILGNRVTLGQLFLNLLMNSCQLQPEGGQIELATMRDADTVSLIVADCGPGIAPEVLPHIFEPFYSTRGSTGLGLSVCHGIVAEHNGKIWAQNRPGGGAIFQVEFPLISTEAEAGRPEAAARLS